MTMIRCLEDHEIEKQMKCKICDEGLHIFGCFKKNHTTARFSYMMRGVNPIYRQITTRKICTLNFIPSKTRYIGLALRF
jgi:hypothetical protein